jgi:YtkA-like
LPFFICAGKWFAACFVWFDKILNFMKSYYWAACAIAGIGLMCLFGSCKKESNNQVQYPIPSNLVMVSSGYASGAGIRVEVYAANTLFPGYNPVYLALYDSVSNKRITQAKIALSALVKDGNGSQINGVIENPSSVNATNGLFTAALVFVSANNTWMLGAQVQNAANNKTGSFMQTVNVTPITPARSYSAIALDDSSNLFIAMVQPFNPQIGDNNFEMAVYKQQGTGNFVADSSYTISINPQMPGMSGMTSPNNVNPVYSGNAHYTGKVIFTMFGAWEIDIRMMHNNAVSDTTHYFDVNLNT